MTENWKEKFNEVKTFIQHLLDQKDEEKRQLVEQIINDIPTHFIEVDFHPGHIYDLKKLKQQLRDKYLSH